MVSHRIIAPKKFSLTVLNRCYGNPQLLQLQSIKPNLLWQPIKMTQQKPKTEVVATKSSKSFADQVREDGVMKELFRKEQETRQSWEKKWGFMKNPEMFWVYEADRRGLPPGAFSERDDKPRPGVSSWSEYKTENIKLLPSGKIPERSSGMIGWRSSVAENDYNRLVGPLYVSKRTTMNPPLAEDEPDPERHKFIFLG